MKAVPVAPASARFASDQTHCSNHDRIAVMAEMLVLSALGVNIGPLLAGAGIVGLAIELGLP